MGSGHAGYSGTPLAKKLGLKPGMRVCALGAPRAYREIVVPWPDDIELQACADPTTDFVHLFVDSRSRLAAEARRLRSLLGPNATLWISWPKKASEMPTDITEDSIREIVLPLGWVDVKVCAVDVVWSGLKLVVRKSLR
jgi:hypothetical protein